MRSIAIVVCAATVVAASVRPAEAQEKGHVGITMGYPASIGLLWHMSERVAIRPELSFNRTDNSSSGIVAASSTFWVLGTGVSALFYSQLRDNLRTYVAPRFSYSRTHGDSDITTSTTTLYSVAGMFGAQYALGRRFGVFGELGFGYTRQKGSTATSVISSTTASTSNSIGTRTGIGAVLYF